MTFNFHHLKVDYPNGEKWALAPFDFKQLKNILFNWQVGMQEGNGWNAVFWCNHDQPRVLSRFGDDVNYPNESAKMLATAIHLMRGTPYIYQGEEIGMTNPKFESIDKYRDVESINAYNNLKNAGKFESEIINILQSKSRDNSRTPMQWDDNGGFTGGKPWIDMANNYNIINASNSVNDPNSVYNYYKSLIKIRKDYEVISNGNIVPIMKDDERVLAYIRENNDKQVLVICNFFDEEVNIKLDKKFISKDSEILISNYEEVNLKEDMNLRPYDSFAIMV